MLIEEAISSRSKSRVSDTDSNGKIFSSEKVLKFNFHFLQTGSNYFDLSENFFSRLVTNQ